MLGESRTNVAGGVTKYKTTEAAASNTATSKANQDLPDYSRPLFVITPKNEGEEVKESRIP